MRTLRAFVVLATVIGPAATVVSFLVGVALAVALVLSTLPNSKGKS